MKMKNFPILTISGYLIFSVYYGFLFIAALIYGQPVDPIYAFFPSDYGNYEINPDGAFFYDLGTILAGCLLFPFCIGLFKWRGQGNRSNKILLLGQISGCCAGIGLIFGGSFSNDTWSSDIHYMAAIAIFFFLFLTFIFTTIALFKHPKMSRVVSIYCVLVMVVDIFLATLQMAILEWITIFTAMLYVVLISRTTWKNNIESISSSRSSQGIDKLEKKR